MEGHGHRHLDFHARTKESLAYSVAHQRIKKAEADEGTVTSNPIIERLDVVLGHHLYFTQIPRQE